jgi:Cys-tRNA(Pro)/Cys-tRNA(Cys) deacylase
MIKSKDLLQLTGYIHGGCSPLCMKRPLKTMIDSSVESQKTIFFSAGKVGYQIEIEFTDLQKAMDIKMTALVM